MSERKGLPWFAWVGIGCGVLVILFVVAVGGLGLFVGSKVKDLAEDFEERPVYTAAATIARFNPEIELVDADEEARTVTLRQVSSGEVMTFDFTDIQSGNFSFVKDGERVDVNAGDSGITVTTDEGTARFGAGNNTELPDWLPMPTGATADVGYSASNDSESSGLAQLQNFGNASDVLEFYRAELKKAGYDVSDQNINNGDVSISSVTGQLDSPKRTISVTHNQDGTDEQLTVTYNGKN